MRLNQVFTSTFIKLLCVGAIVSPLAIFSGCGDKEKGINNLIGKWTVTKAYRGSRLTETLEDAYFEFSSDTSFQTNIYNDDASYRYELTDNGFNQLTPDKVSFEANLTGIDSLKLEATIRGNEFVFLAIRDTTVVELISL